MRETTGGSAGTHPAACSSPSHSPYHGGKEKKGNLPLYTAKTYLTSQAVLLHFLKPSWSLCNNFPTIALVHSNATAFPFGPYTVCVLPMTKGNCTLKCIQLCVVIFFSWHIFTKKCSPDLIMNVHTDQIEGHIRTFVVKQTKAVFNGSGIIWSKEECRNRPDLLFLFDWAFCEGKERNVSPSLRGHLRHLWRGCKKLNSLVTEKTRCLAHYRGELSFRLNFYEHTKASSLKQTQGCFAFSKVGYYEVIGLTRDRKEFKWSCVSSAIRTETHGRGMFPGWSVTSDWMRCSKLEPGLYWTCWQTWPLVKRHLLWL